MPCCNWRCCCRCRPASAAERWTEQQAHEWYNRQPWLVGANYIPANAINQLEMWQADSFDPATIDKELGWAQSIGMNTMRVYLHNLLWEQDAKGFKQRIDAFLAIAAKHNIKPIFVLFDSCWDPEPKLGPQHPPIPGVHNSGWVQAPGRARLEDASGYPKLREYVQGVVGAFAKDDRILAWDVWNEPDNDGGGNYPKHVGKQKLVETSAGAGVRLGPLAEADAAADQRRVAQRRLVHGQAQRHREDQITQSRCDLLPRLQLAEIFDIASSAANSRAAGAGRRPGGAAAPAPRRAGQPGHLLAERFEEAGGGLAGQRREGDPRRRRAGRQLEGEQLGDGGGFGAGASSGRRRSATAAAPRQAAAARAWATAAGPAGKRRAKSGATRSGSKASEGPWASACSRRASRCSAWK